jgi:inorganic pyrophosphatase
MHNLSPGKNPPEEINVYVEIPQDSSIKYELDKESGVIFVDRFLFTAFSYPFNYGFIPGTMAQDGDPTDVLVLSSKTVAPGTVIPSVPIGMLEMEDEAGIDTKILAVPQVKIDPYYGTWKSLEDVPQSIKDKIKHFFEHYKELEPNKWVKLKDWKDKQSALEDIRKSLKK